jgi:hypothetical protein
MTSKQFAALHAAIQEWADGHCEDADWPDVIIGDKTVELMAKAARAVFDACEESQQFAAREGYTVSPHALNK